MDDMFRLVIEQAPTMLGLVALAAVLYRQNEKAQQANDKLLERIISLTIEIRDCAQTVREQVSQQKETD